MNQELRNGQILNTLSSGQCTIEQLLGGCGQGEVYKVDLKGIKYALKWYYHDQATDMQRASLEKIIAKGAPTKQFLWPLMLVSSDNSKNFGYIMPLRNPDYKSIIDLMKRRIKPEVSFYTLATAGLELAYSYLQLHSKGLAYRDISFGNVFFNPHNGSIMICDNDNVSVDENKACGIYGTAKFMAPEIVRGDAVPSTQTDLFSLAVLLFYIFIMHHPLEGKKEIEIKCFDEPAMKKLYGIEPVFIFDPNNNSNVPISGFHDNAIAFWPIYPKFIKDLFIKSFTEGIKDAQNGRVRESEWRNNILKLRDSIFYCGTCGNENFYDIDLIKNNNGDYGTCWSCQKKLILPFRIKIGKTIVMLNHNSKLYEYHLIDDPRTYTPEHLPVAEISKHPTNPNIWGLKNLSKEKWVAINANDTTPKEIENGKSVKLEVGTKINFGKCEGEIKY